MTCGLEVITEVYVKYPAGVKYQSLIEYMKREIDLEKPSQLGSQMVMRVIAHVKHNKV